METRLRKSAVSITTRLHPLLNNCVLFALVKLAFVALLLGTFWGLVPGSLLLLEL